ncbi:MAG: Na(+)/H(+) antiporter subunit D [Parvibaculum sp.]|nr:Na(+)/H(+) antiporter subunit D [Parvibaculum sp.]
MTNLVMPSLVYFAAACLAPLIPHARLRAVLLLGVPVLAAATFFSATYGTSHILPLFDTHLKIFRLDALSYVFALVFSLAAFLSLLYAAHIRDRLEQVSTLIYAGSAIGAVFAGDLVTLFVFWEGTAIASVFLIWSRRTEGSYATGLRYITAQIASGLLLLIGIVLFYHDTGSVAFERMTLDSTATWCIFIAFGIKCAFPLLHNWLQDSYPAATLTGTVTLSAFTTKLAVYALARGFAGTEYLIYIGAVMTLFPVFFAAIENNLRRVLSYSLNNQLGFMVVGVGIGTPLALDGTVAHAFAHVIYKSLLFMSVGAVLYRTGTDKASELGGLWKSMPLTMVLCIVGAMSISAFPLFSGFIAKSLIVSASEPYLWVWFALMIASVGVLEHAGIKIPFSMFFGHRSAADAPKVEEAPLHMIIAMSFAAGLCIAIGVWPENLYAILPYPVDYVPYTTAHVVTQLQLLFFAILAFALLMRFGLYPLEYRSINLEFDWLYRRFLPRLVSRLAMRVTHAWRSLAGRTTAIATRILSYSPPANSASTGTMVLWIAILLGIVLCLAYL